MQRWDIPAECAVLLRHADRSQWLLCLCGTAGRARVSPASAEEESTVKDSGQGVCVIFPSLGTTGEFPFLLLRATGTFPNEL